MRWFCHDLRELGEAFAAQRDCPPLPRTMPPHSGAIAWARSLLERAAGADWKAGGGVVWLL